MKKGLIDYSVFRLKSIQKNEVKTINRQLLYDHWASWKCFLKFQPIKEIEQYFGTKVAFYFAFFGNLKKFRFFTMTKYRFYFLK
jgi:hypothetical protein